MVRRSKGHTQGAQTGRGAETGRGHRQAGGTGRQGAQALYPGSTATGSQKSQAVRSRRHLYPGRGQRQSEDADNVLT